MTGRWAATSKKLVLSIVVCAMGLLVFGFYSSKESAAEKAAMACAFAMSGFFVASLGWILAYLVWLRRQRKPILQRRPLSDDEFMAQLAVETPVHPVVLTRVRALASKRFRSIGGDRFYPGDRLEEDLHLGDIAPWATEDFFNDLFEFIAGSDATSDTDVPVPVMLDGATFGDVVRAVNHAYRIRMEQGTVPGET